MSKLNLQKSPIPLDLIGSAVEVLTLIIEAIAKRTQLRARVQLLENTDITQAHQFVAAEREREELRETIQDLQRQMDEIKSQINSDR
jgi:hypothetical protein